MLDFPDCIYALYLYIYSSSKVVLTVRKNPDVWYTSFTTFFRYQGAVFHRIIFHWFQVNGIFGPVFENMWKLSK